MNREIIVGVVYSKYDEKIGPKAFAWYPKNLSKSISSLVSLKSLGLLSTDQETLPRALEIISFPSINTKGLIKFFQIQDTERRGGVENCTITLVFHEQEDMIFYKYINNFREPFEQVVEDILLLEKQKAKIPDFSMIAQNLYNNITRIIDELYDISEREAQEFPQEPRSKGNEKPLRMYKVIVCGDPQVGKTSIILRFTNNAFKKTYIETMGVNLSQKTLEIDETTVEFVLWDIAGQAKYQNMRMHFYEGAKAKLIVFDLTSPESLENVKKWNEDIGANLKKTITGFLIGNKKDLIDEIKVTSDEVMQIASDLDIEYIETSASTGENINEVFYQLAKKLLKK